jgi:ribose-phosphate pyrophosphokinase
MDRLKVFACNSAEEFTKKVCDQIGIEPGKIEAFKFKNDNTFVKVLETVREDDVFVVQTIKPPVDERIMELLITIEALKMASAKRVTAVVPYYPYARSDKKDQPRVPITAKLVADLLVCAGADRVLTCDLHNPAIQGFISVPSDQLRAKDILTSYFRKMINGKADDYRVVATDAGSSKSAYKYARRLGTEIALVDKQRFGNDDKAIASHVIGDVKDKICIILDDEVDTAGSMMEAVRVLEDNGAKEIYAACTHGVLSADAVEKIKNSSLKEMVITNTVPLPKEKQIDKIKVLDIAPLFGKAILRIHNGEAIGELFEDKKVEF